MRRGGARRVKPESAFLAEEDRDAEPMRSLAFGWPSCSFRLSSGGCHGCRVRAGELRDREPEPCHAEAWPEPRAWPESKLSTVGCNDNCSSRERKRKKAVLALKQTAWGTIQVGTQPVELAPLARLQAAGAKC